MPLPAPRIPLHRDRGPEDGDAYRFFFLARVPSLTPSRIAF
jgi:hypothetical protein